MSVVYHCLACDYVAEESEMPVKCKRCLDGEVEPLTPDRVVTMLEAGEVYQCQPCRMKIHSR